jgi:hypothetical protein
MITMDLVLRIGVLDKYSELDQTDCIELELYEDLAECLKEFNDDINVNYARLELELNTNCDEKIVLAAFKKMVTKTKSGKKVHWVLV